LVYLIAGVQKHFVILKELYSSIAHPVFEQLLKAIVEAARISLSAQHRRPFSSLL
jgi:hypothetical protein